MRHRRVWLDAAPSIHGLPPLHFLPWFFMDNLDAGRIQQNYCDHSSSQLQQLEVIRLRIRKTICEEHVTPFSPQIVSFMWAIVFKIICVPK